MEVRGSAAGWAVLPGAGRGWAAARRRFGQTAKVLYSSPCPAAATNPPRHPPVPRFSLYEPVEFIRHFLADRLEWRAVRDTVAVHVPCSSKKMSGLDDSFMKVRAMRLRRSVLLRRRRRRHVLCDV